MLPRVALVVLLLSSVLVAPMSSAASPACYTSPPKEELTKSQEPLKEGYYVYAGSEVGKTGVWKESNGVAGLQTSECWNSGHTALLIRADTPADAMELLL